MIIVHCIIQQNVTAVSKMENKLQKSKNGKKKIKNPYHMSKRQFKNKFNDNVAPSCSKKSCTYASNL